MAISSTTVERRLDRVRGTMRLAGYDALVVTHLPNLRYLTGFSGTAGLAVLTADACILLVDFRYATAAHELTAALGGDAIRVEMAAGSYDESLAGILRRLQVQRIAIEAAWMPVSRFNRLSGALAAAAPLSIDAAPCPVLVPSERAVESARIVKDPDEVATLREAARRLSTVARELPAWVRPGRTERAIAGDIEAAIRRAGFEKPAFETIVASGPNAALPHARPCDRELRAGDGVVLDFGGVYDGYCVDLTRTIGVGEQGPELRRLFAAVAEAHGAALAAVRPGAMPSAIDGAARDVLERHGLGEAFGHGTGHGLGLEVHEEPRISRAIAGQPEAPVEPGMVFTIEPGAYVAGLGGVRIEDDVVVVDGGCEVLTDVPLVIEAGSGR